MSQEISKLQKKEVRSHLEVKDVKTMSGSQIDGSCVYRLVQKTHTHICIYIYISIMRGKKGGKMKQTRLEMG